MGRSHRKRLEASQKGDRSTLFAWQAPWRKLEPTHDAEVVPSAAPEDRTGELALFPTEREEANHASLVEVMADVTHRPAQEVDDADQAGQRAAVKAFQAAVSEAQQEAETQLTTVIARIRKEAADQQTAELARVTDRHAEELQQARDGLEAEVTAAIERIRQEEAERHAAEFVRVREELERQHADDLQRVQTAVVESFRALAGSILQRG